MKLALLSSASAAALLLLAAPGAIAAPAPPPMDFTGVGQLYLGVGTVDGGFFSGKFLDDPFTYGGKAKGLWPLSQDLHFQFDLFAEHNDDITKNWATRDDANMWGAAFHLLHPFEDRARFGFAGSIWTNDVFADVSPGRLDATYGLAALEGQGFGDDWTLMGQAGAFTQMDCDTCGGTFENGTFIRGKARWFLHDNTVLSAETVQMWGSLSDDDGFFSGKSVTAQFAQWILDVEHRFDDSEWAGAITLSHETTDTEFFNTSETNSVMFTLKYYYGQPSLRANDRYGAELDTPQFGNALETAGILSLGSF